MNKVLIIDDEQHCIDTLSQALAGHDQYKIVATAQNLKDSLQKTKQHQPDLVFLDVELGPETGFDYLSQLTSINFEVIFTTAHEHYALKAIHYSALHYLLKPIDSNDLRDALDRFNNRKEGLAIQDRLDTLIHNMSGPETSKRIYISTTEGYLFIDLSNIIYLKAAESYTYVYPNNGARRIASKTLKFFHELLPKDQFYRVHKSYVVNIEHIVSYRKASNGEVVMSDGTVISVSLRRKDHFLKTVFPNT